MVKQGILAIISWLKAFAQPLLKEEFTQPKPPHKIYVRYFKNHCAQNSLKFSSIFILEADLA